MVKPIECASTPTFEAASAMSDTPPPMMEESVGIMAAVPGGMEDVTETMVTGPYA